MNSIMQVRVTRIKNARNQLGCGLQEAADFVGRHGNDYDNALAAALAEKKRTGQYYVTPESKIRDAIRAYHLKLDQGVGAITASVPLIEEIETILSIKYVPGLQLERRELNAS